MSTRFSAGAEVQTPFGKGIVREVRNAGRLLVEVHGRSLILREGEVSPVEGGTRAPRAPRRLASDPAEAAERGTHTRGDVDLHGLTVEEALARAADALNDALLGDMSELRLIHGRSGGRIRGALHAWLRNVAGVRFRTDPRNAGVTIVSL